MTRCAAVFKRKLVPGLLLAAGMAGVPGAVAQSRWMHSLTVPTEIEHDSNPNMSTGESTGTTFLRVTPSLSTKYVYGTEEFTFDAALAAVKSSNTAVAEDRLDPSLRAAWKHVDELNTTELAALVDRRAFRDLDVRRQVPLGVDGSRTLYALTGSWARDLDARTSFTTDVRQEWERSSGGAIPDSRRTAAAARLTWAQNERRNRYASINAQDYRPEEARTPAGAPVAEERSTVVGALVGASHEFSEALRVDVSAGPVHFARPSSRNDWQGGVNAEYKAERWTAGVDLTRAPGVSSTFGGLAVTEELRLRARYDLDPRSHLQADAGHAREKATRSNRTVASLAWVHQWSEAWQVAVKASHQRQQGPEGTARSNRIGVTLVYSALDL